MSYLASQPSHVIRQPVSDAVAAMSFSPGRTDYAADTTPPGGQFPLAASVDLVGEAMSFAAAWGADDHARFRAKPDKSRHRLINQKDHRAQVPPCASIPR